MKWNLATKNLNDTYRHIHNATTEQEGTQHTTHLYKAHQFPPRGYSGHVKTEYNALVVCTKVISSQLPSIQSMVQNHLTTPCVWQTLPSNIYLQVPTQNSKWQNSKFKIAMYWTTHAKINLSVIILFINENNILQLVQIHHIAGSDV